VAIQLLESNVILPMIEKRMVKIPPALFLFAALASGLLFGPLGVLIAAPLTVVEYIAVKKLYVQQSLGQAAVTPVD
jgi:predicted PurR-regulated permease PerM